ncbi:glycine receptor subunit alpha-4-like [Branchiostoma floridae x Branchiostoma belcheri]
MYSKGACCTARIIATTMEGNAAFWSVVLLVLCTVQLMPAMGETRNGDEDVDIAIRTSEGDHKNTSTLADYITVPLDYNNRSRPTTSVIDVDCTMYVLKLGPFLEKEMQFPISFYLGCNWTDHRLNESTQASAYVDESAGKNIWKPTFYISPQSDTNAREEFVEPPMVLPGGQVIIMKKYSLYAPCLMKLHNFPHDQQFCNVHIMIMGGVKASWNAMEFWPVRDKPVLMNMQTVRSVFRVDQVDYVSFAGSSSSPQNTCIYQKATCDYQGSEDCLRTNLRCSEAENQADPVCIKCNNFGGVCSLKPTSNCSSVLKKVSAGVVFVTNLELRLKLTRRLGYHFLQTYIPSVSVVGMSWVSFWIDPASAPARTGLGVTTVLTMVTLSGKIGAAPELNYVRAIDVWMLTCKLFVVLALLEYAFVNFTAMKEKEEQTSAVDVEQQAEQAKKEPGTDLYDCEENENKTSLKKKLKFSVSTVMAEKLPRSLDHVSRVLFPVAFVIFVCAYFGLYVSAE